MLLQLPKELLLTIIFLLDFEDKLNVVLTCHKLKEVISSSLLYEELVFYPKKDALLDALEMFKHNPAYGSQVRRIRLNRTTVTSQALSQIPIVFPKVKEFTSIYGHSEIDNSYMEPMLNWKDTLENYHVPNKRRQITGLLKNNLFSRLSWLSITLIHAFGEHHHSNTIDFHEFGCLENAPSLRHLRLLGGRISLDSMEKIHTVCPQLISLRFSGTAIMAAKPDTLPKFITPVTPLLSFVLDWGTHIEDQNYKAWDYIIAKYTKLTRLEILCDWEDYDTDDNRNLRNPDQFISSLPNTIKILSINKELFDDPLTALEKTGINPIELSFYFSDGCGVFPAEVVKYPKQLYYLKALDSLKTLTLSIRYTDYIVLDNITQLTVIAVGDRSYNECELDRLLLAHPSLRTLTIRERNDLITISNGLEQTTYSHFRKLSLKNQGIDPKVIDFIRTSLPNIRELDIPIFGKRRSNGRLWYLHKPETFGFRTTTDHNVCINLSGCVLDILNLSVTWEERLNWFDTLLYLEIQTTKESRCYTVTTRSYRCVYVSLTSLDAVREESNIVRIVCDDIKTFKINDKDIKSLFYKI